MRSLVGIALFGMLVLLSIAMIPTTSGETFIVDDDDKGSNWSNYTAIQDAIDGAARGDTVLIYNGTYLEDLNVSEEVDLIGNGSSEVFLECSGLTHGINVTTWNVNITGLSINNTENASLHGGLRLWGANYAQVNDIVATNCGNGLLVHSSDDVTVYNVHCYDNGFHGIRSYFSDDLSISRVNASYNYHDGINLYGNNDTVIVGSQVHQNNPIELYHGGGVYIKQSENCTIYGNTITNNRYHGAMAYQSYFIEVEENHIFKNCGGHCGILLEESSDCTVYNNNVSSNTGQAIELYEGCKRTTIQDNIFNDNGRYGARIGEGSNDTMFLGNVVMGNDDHAVRMYDAENVTIKWNQILDNEGTGKYAIQISYSAFIRVLENNVSGNVYGVIFDRSDNINFSGNNVSDNNGTAGIMIDDCDHVLISNNTIARNGYGIGMDEADSYETITIVYNEIFNNSSPGIYMPFNVANGSVHHNNFMNNDYDGTDVQAVDDGDSLWDDGAEGNWWSDWGGSGNYSIGGSGDSHDEYPLGDPAETDAPEKVPEFGLLFVVSLILISLAVFRRRR